MVGSTIRVMVSAPLRLHLPIPSSSTKKIMPNMPNTIEGMPDRDSVNSRMTLTSLLPGFAYSTR